MALKFDHQRDKISTNSGDLTIDTTGSLVVPVGTNAEQPTGISGSLRFNSDTQAFEGYDGTAWNSVGGTIDADRNTYITAKPTYGLIGSSADTLYFVTAGTERMNISPTGDILFGDGLDKFTVDFATGNTEIAGTLTVTGTSQATFPSLNVTDLTDNRIVIVGTNGELEDSANLTFDGSTLSLTGNSTVSNDIDVGGQAILASANIEDLTDNRIVIVGTDGELEDDANFTFDGTEFVIGGGDFTVQIDGETYIGNSLTVTGDLTVNGTTTTVNSTTVTIDDPIFTLGGDTAPTADDNKDRGIEFNWHNGTSAKVGFFGFDDSTGRLTFIPDGTNTSEVFSGFTGDVEFNTAYLTAADISDIQIGVSTGYTIDTKTSDLVLDSATGTTQIDDDAVVTGTLDVYGHSTLASVSVQDLTTFRIPYTEVGGGLADSANLEFYSNTFDVGQGNFTVAALTGNVSVGGHLVVTDYVSADSLYLTNITDNRILIAGASNIVEDDANFRFDGTDFDIGAAGSETFTVNVTSGNTAIGGTLGVTGHSTLASLSVSDLSDNYIVLSESGGGLTNDTNLSFNGLTFDIGTGAFTVAVGTGNVSTDGYVHALTDVSAEEFYANNLTDNRILIAGTSGHIEDDANFRFDGTNFDIGAAGSETFTVNVATGNTSVAGNLTLAGNLVVNGTTTTVNSTTVTIDDPIFTIGGDTAPTIDDNKDRGIEFNWHNGTTAKVGFFGYDDSSGSFTFIPDATNTSEVFSGTAGNVNFGNGTFTGLTSNGDMYVTGILDVDDQVTVASVNVEDLTSGRIVLAGALGELEDSADLTFDGTTLNVGQGGLTYNTSLETLNVTGSGVFTASIDAQSAYINDLSEGRITYYSLTSGLTDSANFRFSGANFMIGPNGSETFAVHVTSGNTTVGGNLTLGTSTAVSAILDEDNLISNSATALATQQSIKAYVDAEVGSIVQFDLDFAGDTGTGTVTDVQTFTVAGTTNEIETSASGQTITIGLPDDVIIGNDLTVTGDATANAYYGDGTTLTGVATEAYVNTRAIMFAIALG